MGICVHQFEIRLKLETISSWWTWAGMRAYASLHVRYNVQYNFMSMAIFEGNGPLSRATTVGTLI